MTEKRFKVNLDFVYDSDGELYSLKECCELLNKYDKENEQLKDSNKELVRAITELKGLYEIYYEKSINLEQENEQLKHELLCKQLDKAPTEPINCKCHYKEL